MLLERYYDETLAQASYIIGCERSRDAIVIDPNRDVERYLRGAAAHGLRIRYVTETHIHADYLSGSRDLARAAAHAGTRGGNGETSLLLSDHGGKDWSYGSGMTEAATLIKEGDTITVGAVRLDVLHTPGHTPEHLCFLVTDTATGDRPVGMATGDFLFVGDVGRPDLLERAAKLSGTMEASARQLYASLERLGAFPDYLQIWPGHGAGSACGKSLGAVPQTTLGYERLYNPALQQTSEDAFVRWVLADQPEPPPYFAEMKRLNRDGPPGPRSVGALPQLDTAALDDALGAGTRAAWVVDVRGSAEFARGHVPGSINIPLARTFTTYAGTVLTYDRGIVLIAKSEDQAAKAAQQLGLIGLDDVRGWAALDVLQQMKSQGRQLASVKVVDPQTLAAETKTDGPRVIDVRGRPEWNAGHLPRATHVYLGDLTTRASEFRHDEPIVLHCQSGTRSSIAASLLMARGFSDVSNLAGGFDAWRRAGLPIIRDEEQSR